MRRRSDAIRFCENHKDSIDLMLTDVIMPRLKGPELAARARISRPHLKVLVKMTFTFDEHTVKTLRGAVHRLFTSHLT